MSKHTNCIFCRSQNTEIRKSSDDFSYKGQTLKANFESVFCLSCEEEYVPKQLANRNDARASDARRRLDGLLTTAEIKRARKMLSLTQEDASAFFGGGRHAFSKYERGLVTQSVSMDRLIRLCVSDHRSFSMLKSLTQPSAVGSFFAGPDVVEPFSPKETRKQQLRLVRSFDSIESGPLDAVA